MEILYTWLRDAAGYDGFRVEDGASNISTEVDQHGESDSVGNCEPDDDVIERAMKALEDARVCQQKVVTSSVNLKTRVQARGAWLIAGRNRAVESILGIHCGDEAQDVAVRL